MRRVGDIGTWTADECAAAWGVKTPTFLGYVSRGQAPAALSDRPGGRRVWDADEVRRFPRPGPGRSRAGAGADAEALLAEMREVAEADRGTAGPAAGAAGGGQGAGPGDRTDGEGPGDLPADRLQLARRLQLVDDPPTLVHTSAGPCTSPGTCARHTRGVHGRASARSGPATFPKRPRAAASLCHRRRVQVTVEPEALAEWSAHARRTGASLDTRLAALDRDLAPLARAWHGAAADGFAARHRQWRARGGRAGPHAEPARVAGGDGRRQLPGGRGGEPPHLAHGVRARRRGDGRGSGPHPGGRRGHPGGGPGPDPRRGRPDGGMGHAGRRAHRVGRDGRWRRGRGGVRRGLRRHGRSRVAGLAPLPADGRRDRRGPGVDRQQPGRGRARLHRRGDGRRSSRSPHAARRCPAPALPRRPAAVRVPPGSVHSGRRRIRNGCGRPPVPGAPQQPACREPSTRCSQRSTSCWPRTRTRRSRRCAGSPEPRCRKTRHPGWRASSRARAGGSRRRAPGSPTSPSTPAAGSATRSPTTPRATSGTTRWAMSSTRSCGSSRAGSWRARKTRTCCGWTWRRSTTSMSARSPPCAESCTRRGRTGSRGSRRRWPRRPRLRRTSARSPRRRARWARRCRRPQRQALVEEVVAAGHKISPADVVQIARAPDGRVVWLERGDGRAGLSHILRAGRIREFTECGVAYAEIPGLAVRAVTHGTRLGTGARRWRRLRRRPRRRSPASRSSSWSDRTATSCRRTR